MRQPRVRPEVLHQCHLRKTVLEMGSPRVQRERNFRSHAEEGFEQQGQGLQEGP